MADDEKPSLVLPPEHPNSLYYYVSWVKRSWTLGTVSALLFALNMSIIIYFAVIGQYHLYMYTYWNFLLITVLLGCILIGLIVQGWFEVTVALVLAPMVMGSVMLVVIIIAIVVTIDDRIYWADTVCAGGTLTFALLRLADWVLHGLPPVEVFLLMLFDYKIYMRMVLFHLLRSRHWAHGLLYSIFFLLSPSPLMLLYSCIQDISRRYPTSLSNVQFTFLAIALCLGIMAIWYLALLVHVDDRRVLVPFYTRSALGRARQKRQASRSKKVESVSTEIDLSPKQVVCFVNAV
jgi:hypothetical protein